MFNFTSFIETSATGQPHFNFDAFREQFSAALDQTTAALSLAPESQEAKDFAAELQRACSQATHQASAVVEKRPECLECDVVRFQNNKEKWVALVGLLNGQPYEIFTGLQDDDEGIILPKSVTSGFIIKHTNADGTKRYDFQFQNKRGYKTTVEGLSEKFNPEYWNYAKLISGVLRYRMPLDHVIKLVSQLELTNENINTWKNGVERALKKYTKYDPSAASDLSELTDGSEPSEPSAPADALLFTDEN